MHLSFIDPGDVYPVTTSIKIYLMMVLGGGGTVLGPVGGAFFIEFISELVWGKFLELHLLVLGFILVFVVIFAPKGFMDLFQRGIRLDRWVAIIKENRI